MMTTENHEKIERREEEEKRQSSKGGPALIPHLWPLPDKHHLNPVNIIFTVL